MPLLADEPTRALVALEMYLSENYIVPTINGEYYYNKPPLYNWLLVGLYHVTGSMEEWVVRIPTVASVFLFGIIIFFFVRKYFDAKTAVFTIFAFVTCGRVLFYDSFLGLIDTLFSALIFLNFMVVYHYDKKEKYLEMFVLSYMIITVCYFLKGLPALVFEFVTLITFAFIRKKISTLFFKYHFTGIAIFLISLIVYYAQYLKYNTLEVLMKTLLSESTKRTPAEHGWVESVVHFFTFPFEMIMHFLPWTFPLVLLIKKANRSYVMENDFLKYNLMMVLANIFVYWLSPETRPRYLFMFLPSLFIVSSALFYYSGNLSFRKVFEKVLLGLLLLFMIAPFAIPFLRVIPSVDYNALKITVLFMSLLLCVVFYYKNIEFRLILFCIALLIVRIGFNWFVFPSRLQTEPQTAYRDNSILVGRLTKGQPLYAYKYTPVNHDVSFYVSRERKEILQHSFLVPKKNTFYLTDVFEGALAKGKIYHQFHTSYNNTLLYLIRIEE